MSEISNKQSVRLAMPQAEPSGFVPTLNQMGYMTSTLDPTSMAFLSYSQLTQGTVLDIGAAYGVASIEALKNQAKVIANDIDERHLEILREKTPPDLRKNLTLLPGKFPEVISLPPESLDAILICRVLHFFKGEQMIEALKKAHGWLKKGGKVFLITETPFLKNFAKFLPVFEDRKQKKIPWPGLAENPQLYTPLRGGQLPPFIHFLDKEGMTKVLSESGFKVEKCEYMPRKDFPLDLQLDGRESIGGIGVKH